MEGAWGTAALIGKAGESLVAAELMRKGVNIAFPAYDGGIDLLAYRELNFSRVVPVQVKARSGSCYHFQRSWFRVPSMVLVQVWYVTDKPQFYLFRNLEEIETALGATLRPMNGQTMVFGLPVILQRKTLKECKPIGTNGSVSRKIYDDSDKGTFSNYRTYWHYSHP